MAYIRTETLGDDGLWHHLYAGPEYIVNNITSDVPSDISPQETMETYQASPGEKLFLLIQTKKLKMRPPKDKRTLESFPKQKTKSLSLYNF